MFKSASLYVFGYVLHGFGAGLKLAGQIAVIRGQVAIADGDKYARASGVAIVNPVASTSNYGQVN